MNDAMARLVGQAYEATIDQSLWPKVLADLSALTGARGAHILLFDSDNKVAFGHIGKLPHECHQEYVDHYAVLDPRTKRAIAWPDHVVWRDEDLMTQDELRRSPTHHELFRKFDIHRAIGLKNRVAGGGWFTAVVTSWPGGGGFSSDHVSQFEFLYPHLERAARIKSVLAKVDPIAQCCLDTLERLDVGVVICDRHARVRHANSYARSAFLRNCAVRLGHGNVLAAYLPSDTATLARVIGDACANSSGGDASIRGPNGKQYIVTVMRSNLHDEITTNDQSAIVFIREGSNISSSNFTKLDQIYGLTNGETKLVTALLGGISLADYAKSSFISVETARTLLKRAMSKTETHSQGQLIAKLFRESLPIR